MTVRSFTPPAAPIFRSEGVQTILQPNQAVFGGQDKNVFCFERYFPLGVTFSPGREDIWQTLDGFSTALRGSDERRSGWQFHW
jgi:hypothetical protein